MQITCVCVRERGEDIFFKFQDRSSHIGDNYGLGNHRGESGRMMSCGSGESSILLKLVVNHNRFAHLCELWVVDEKLFAWLENAREWLQVCTLHPPIQFKCLSMRQRIFFLYVFRFVWSHLFARIGDHPCWLVSYLAMHQGMFFRAQPCTQPPFFLGEI